MRKETPMMLGARPANGAGLSTSRRGMTSNGALVLAAVAGLALLVGALASTWVRSELKIQATRETLARLDAALSAYHKAVGHWPADRTPAVQKESSRPRTRRSGTEDRNIAPSLLQAADRVLAALASVPESKAALDDIPRVYRTEPEVAGMEQPPEAAFSLVDGWRHRLGCLTASSLAERDRRAVAASGGRPIFISPGPDGVFGGQSVACAADDLFLQPGPRPSTRPGP